MSDSEFEREVYMAMGSAGALPSEVAAELAKRNAQGGRDKERSYDAHNPKQLTLPIDQ